MQRLFIAEKPSLARAIAENLPGQSQKQDGYIVCGGDTVTWCFGHLMELCDPDDYDPAYKRWDREQLPIIPATWKYKARGEGAGKQLAVIGRLLKEATSVVNAGDPDREGQLLVDEVLEHFHYHGPAERIWLASLDAKSVGKALVTLTDNKKHAPLRDAARARSQADWLVGMNATRAMTLLGQDAGREGVLSLGRVQTPTLNLVVMRDREIAAFKPHDYFTLQAALDHPQGAFTAKFLPQDATPGLDSEGRLTDAKAAEAIASTTRSAEGTISSVTKQEKKEAAPLPHCLSSLQKAASAKFGMTAQEVLDTAQSLYEKKLTTYPRSDCRYLPLEQFEAAPDILAMLTTVPGLEQAAQNANATLKSGAWDTKKITAHHAIIPTGEQPKGLTPKESQLYGMIGMAYCLQFYPVFRYEAQKISVSIKDTSWEARGRLILEAGWTRCAKDDDEAEEKEKDQSLPAVKQKDAVNCTDVVILSKKTSPPPRFTEGSLIEAMANVHRFVADASAKATLKENEGIGTEATRAKVLETLKGRGYLKASGKALVSTPLAGQVIDLTPPALKDPVTTALWESKLESIAQGGSTLQSFMDEQVKVLPATLSSLLRSDGATTIKREGPMYPCPECGKPLQKRTGEKGPYWCCLRKEEHSDAKPVFLPDNKDKPGQRKEAPKASEYVCPDCGKPLHLYNRVSKKTGKPFQVFNCSGYPQCKKSYFVKNGKPDFEGK